MLKSCYDTCDDIKSRWLTKCDVPNLDGLLEAVNRLEREILKPYEIIKSNKVPIVNQSTAVKKPQKKERREVPKDPDEQEVFLLSRCLEILEGVIHENKNLRYTDFFSSDERQNDELRAIAERIEGKKKKPDKSKDNQAFRDPYSEQAGEEWITIHPTRGYPTKGRGRGRGR